MLTKTWCYVETPLPFPASLPTEARTTEFSPCRQYRYTLWRTWDMFLPTSLMVVGLNPSTADATQDDPTVRRCIDYAKRWGYGALCMTNIFGYRSTDPTHLGRIADPVGPANDAWLLTCAHAASLILVAWGVHGQRHGRAFQVETLLAPFELRCLGRTREGFPRHPLYVAKHQEALLYRSPVG